MNKIVVALLVFVLAACSGVRSASVVPVQSRDKQLNCREILLEINEAEQYKYAAERNTNPDLRAFIAPLGYMYTMTSANDAIESSNKRIAYLQEVYNLSGCGNNMYGGPSGLTDEQMRGHTFTGGFPTQAPPGR
jgi:hypothetical protein